MSTAHQSLSAYNSEEIPNAEPFRFGIVVAEWNHEITEALLEGVYDSLLKAGVKKENLITLKVPGSFELTAGAALLAKDETLNAIICLGCVIQGETRHFDFICHAVSQGLTQLTVKFSRPFIFGVLTTENQEQAFARAGGKFGNKGIEAGITALKMAALFNH